MTFVRNTTKRDFYLRSTFYLKNGKIITKNNEIRKKVQYIQKKKILLIKI